MKVIFELDHYAKIITGRKSMDGIGRYIEEVARELIISSDEDPLYELSLSFLAYPQFAELAQKRFLDHGLSPNTIKLSQTEKYIYNCMLHSGLPFSEGANIGKLVGYRNFDRAKADIIHWPLRIIGNRKSSTAKNIVTVYDLIPLIQPDLCPNSTRLPGILRHVAKNADHFISISETTKQDFCEYFNVSEDQVTVAPLAVNDTLFYQVDDFDQIHRTKAKYGIDCESYVLTLSAIDPRKNIRALMDAFVDMSIREGRRDIKLVIAGGDRGDNLRKFLASNPEYLEHVILTGYVENEDLAAIYSGASVFAFPSLAEGFGLPLLEAMKCGVPTLTSNISSLPEVAGGASMLVDPYSIESISDSLTALLGDESLRHKYGQDGLTNACKYSWSATVDAIHAAYVKCLS